LKKSVIIKLLEHLHSNPAFVLQDADIFQTALKQYSFRGKSFRAKTFSSESNADFSDCIILAHVQKMGMKLSTFDKRLAKLSGATEVQTKK